MPPDAIDKPNVLIVDDDDDVREALRYGLRNRYTLAYAANSAEAMAIITERPNRIDAALVDIKMKGENGLDLLRKLKIQDPCIEVIIMTGYPTEEYMLRAFDGDAFRFHKKPFDVVLLDEQLTAAVASKRKTQKQLVTFQSEDLLNNELFQVQQGVVHDVRNVLTVAIGNMELTNLRLMTKTSLNSFELADIKVELNKVADAIYQCGAICIRNLRVIKAASGQQNEPDTDVEQQIKDLSHNLKAGSRFKYVKFETFIEDPPLPKVFCNATDLLQLLLNIGINAAQSSPGTNVVTISARLVKDPINLTVLQDTPTTRVIGKNTVENKPPFVAITIQDKGSGIAPEVLERLFISPHTTKKQGTGVGIMLIKKLVEQDQLLLLLETTPRAGTTVTLYLRSSLNLPIPEAPTAP